jgi:hypothetical protein
VLGFWPSHERANKSCLVYSISSKIESVRVVGVLYSAWLFLLSFFPFWIRVWFFFRFYFFFLGSFLPLLPLLTEACEVKEAKKSFFLRRLTLKGLISIFPQRP